MVESREGDRASRVAGHACPAKPFSALGSKRVGHRGEMLLWHSVPKGAEIRAFPVCIDHAPATMGREERRGQSHKLEGTAGSHRVPEPRRGGVGVPGCSQRGSRVQPSPQPLLTATKGPGYACIGLFGQIIIVRMTSLPLPLTLAAFKWATHRSKSLYPITSLLSHACPLARYIILKWQLNGKEVVLPIR